MAPQIVNSKGDANLDPLYMQSQADYHYTMAEALSLEGRTEKAAEEFKLTLVYDPNSVAVRLRLAQEYIRQGLITEAVEVVDSALELDEKDETGRMMLGGLYSAMRLYDKALEQYQLVWTQHPANQEAPIYIGALLAEQKETDQAIQHFMKVAHSPLTKEPERAYYYMGRIQAESGGIDSLKKAQKDFQEALKRKPQYPEATLALAGVLKDLEQGQAGIRLLESYQQKFGPQKDIAKVLSRTYLEQEEYEKAYTQLEYIEGFEGENLNVRVQMALILIEQKKFTQAIVRLEDILSQAPDLDKIRYYLGAVYEEIKNPSSAIHHYKMVPPSSSYFVESTIHTAHLLRQQGEFKKSIQVIEEAIRVRADVSQFYAYYATLLDDLKDYRTAIKMLSSAVTQFPEHAQLHFFLGSMQDRVGETKATIKSMERVLEIDKDHVQALNYLAYTFAEQALELDKAEDLARRALALQPNDAYILDTIGWILFKKGKLDQSVRYLEAAYKSKSDESIIVEHLADAYFRQQMLDRARSFYIKAAQLEKDERKLQSIKTKLAATENQIQTQSRVPASAPKANE